MRLMLENKIVIINDKLLIHAEPLHVITRTGFRKVLHQKHVKDMSTPNGIKMSFACGN